MNTVVRYILSLTAILLVFSSITTTMHGGINGKGYES